MNTFIIFILIIISIVIGYLGANRYSKYLSKKDEEKTIEKIKEQKLKFIIDGKKFKFGEKDGKIVLEKITKERTKKPKNVRKK